MRRVPGQVTSLAAIGVLGLLTLAASVSSVVTAPVGSIVARRPSTTEATPAGSSSLGRTNRPGASAEPAASAGNLSPTLDDTTTTAVPAGAVFDVPFAPILVGDLSATRTCSAMDFTARDAGGNGAGGHSALYVDLTDVSSTPCRLEGYPHVVANVPGGTPVVASDGQGWFARGPVLPVVVAPGMTVSLTLETERDCPQRYAQSGVYPHLSSDRVSIGLPGGGTLDVVAAEDVLCLISVSPFEQPPPLGPPPPAAPAFALQPRIDGPSSIPAGSAVSFGVLLRNTSPQAVSLSPCPSFTETVVAGSELLYEQLSYLVNCAAAPGVLEPGDALELRMEAPGPTERGLLDLTWAWGSPYQQGDEVQQGNVEHSTYATVIVK
ncbi:MAG TPA: DUF4232 domain-containing protein [Acidimicrobiales bacterium]|nr:DUF4232 domain-containing protein [Acidimicrobiales bacterium]